MFLIGVRLTRWWKFPLWLKVAVGIWPMLRSLRASSASGLLSYELIYMRGFAFVQYWRSFEHLAAFARDPKDRHMRFWSWFNRTVAASGDLGIWHETYPVAAGHYEAVYGNMPLMGLARAGSLVPMAQKGQSAAKRLGKPGADDAAQPFY